MTAYLAPSSGAHIRFSSTRSRAQAHTTSLVPDRPGSTRELAAAAASPSASVQAKELQSVSKVIMDDALQVPMYYNDGVSVFIPQIKNMMYGQTLCTEGDFCSEQPLVYAAKAK